jgi:hypothetical protein
VQLIAVARCGETERQQPYRQAVESVEHLMNRKWPKRLRRHSCGRMRTRATGVRCVRDASRLRGKHWHGCTRHTDATSEPAAIGAALGYLDNSAAVTESSSASALNGFSRQSTAPCSMS